MTEFILPCGAIYIGKICFGKPTGHGSVTVPMRLKGGHQYIGDLYNSMPHGEGYITYANKLKFTGRFFYGVALCHVVTDFHDIPLSGYYKDVPYYGQGTFSGLFVLGQRDGYGVFTDDDGRTQEGKYTADQMNGKFLCTNETGKQTESVYANGYSTSKRDVDPVVLCEATKRRVQAQLNLVNIEQNGVINGVIRNRIAHETALKLYNVKNLIEKLVLASLLIFDTMK